MAVLCHFGTANASGTYPELKLFDFFFDSGQVNLNAQQRFVVHQMTDYLAGKSLQGIHLSAVVPSGNARQSPQEKAELRERGKAIWREMAAIGIDSLPRQQGAPSEKSYVSKYLFPSLDQLQIDQVSTNSTSPVGCPQAKKTAVRQCAAFFVTISTFRHMSETLDLAKAEANWMVRVGQSATTQAARIAAINALASTRVGLNETAWLNRLLMAAMLRKDDEWLRAISKGRVGAHSMRKVSFQDAAYLASIVGTPYSRQVLATPSTSETARPMSSELLEQLWCGRSLMPTLTFENFKMFLGTRPQWTFQDESAWRWLNCAVFSDMDEPILRARSEGGPIRSFEFLKTVGLHGDLRPERGSEMEQSILLAAIKRKQFDVAKGLLSAGVDPKRFDAFGDTALHLVSRAKASPWRPNTSGNYGDVLEAKDIAWFIKTLLAAGADPNAKNLRGETPNLLSTEVLK